MKCIKMQDSGDIKRVNDNVAQQKVFNKEAKYCPKNLYKSITGNKGPATTAPKIGSKNSNKNSKKLVE